MNDYYNDYNKDLYTAQSEDFCKSCYSSGKSRAGCLGVLAAAVAVCFIYTALASLVSPQISVIVTALLLFLAVAVRIVLKRKRK